MSGITVDISGALKKNEMVKLIPKATRYQLTRFGADTTKSLKMSAMKLKGSDKYRRKTGALSRSVGFNLDATSDAYRLVIGTGVGTSGLTKSAEKYASIQDRGGITHPTVTPRMRKWAWYMFRKYGEDKFKGIALTKKSNLTVRIPASGWFTSVWEHKLQFLKSTYLNDKVILDTAKRMSGGTNAK